MSQSSAYRFCPLCASTLSLKPIESGERLACTQCHFVHWNNPLPVVAALVELEGQILLARNAAWPEKMFALVTGFMEPHEDPVDAMRREVLEETSLQVDHHSLIGVYEFTRKNEVIIAYHAACSGNVRLSTELVDYRLIAPHKLRPWRAGTGHAMADWMRARGLPVEYLDWPPT